MAIGLPPVDVYLSSKFVAYAVPSAAREIKLQLGTAELRVLNVRLLSPTEVRAAIAGTGTLAAAADALADAYEAAGWRNILVVPVDQPGPLVLVVHEAGLSAVNGYGPLQHYFDGFVGPKPIRYSAFAIAAQMADLHSARIGAAANALYVRSTAEPEQLTMKIDGEPAKAARFDYQLRLSNEGNRFVGRWFGGVGASLTGPSSARIGLNYDRVLPELGDARGTPQYNGYTAYVDKVTRHGLVKVLVSDARYRYRGIGADNVALEVAADDPELKASNLHVGLQGERFIYVSRRWRWSLGAGAAWNAYRIDQVGTEAFASERYAAVHGTVGIKWALPDNSLRPQAFLDGLVRQSIDDSFRNTGASSDFRVVSASAGLSVSPFGFGRLALRYEGLWTGDALPQSEQWVLGGFDRLSAWLPGVAVGDRGTLARFSYQIPVFGNRRHDLNAAVTVERGTSEFVGRPEKLASTLSSAGLGLNYRYGRNWRLEGRIGQALQSDAPAEFAIKQQEARFYLRASRSFDAD